MKLNKKILTAFLTASCISVSAFAFASCTPNNPNDNPPPEDKSIELKDGLNTVTLTGNDATVGVTYSYKAAAAGTYAFAVVGDNAQVKVNNTVISNNCYTADLTADQTVKLVCSSLSGDATYSLIAGAAQDWTPGTSATVTVPNLNSYTFGKFTVATAGYYDFNINAPNTFADYSFIINGAQHRTTARGHFTVNLPAGTHAVAMTTNISGSQSSTMSVTVSPFSGETVTEGANVITLSSSQFFSGAEYAFIAPETGLYTFSLSGDTTDALLTADGYDPFIEGNSHRTVVLGKGQLFAITCMSNKENAAEHTYTLNIAKSAYSDIVEIETPKTVLLEDNKAVIKVTPETAGKYILYVDGAVQGDTVTVKVGNADPVSKTSVSFGLGGTRAPFDITLGSAQTEISIEVSTTVTFVEVYITPYIT